MISHPRLHSNPILLHNLPTYYRDTDTAPIHAPIPYASPSGSYSVIVTDTKQAGHKLVIDLLTCGGIQLLYSKNGNGNNGNDKNGSINMTNKY